MKLILNNVIKHIREIEKKIMEIQKCADEHEQIANWLEELKAYREVGTVQGYKDAIDAYNTEYSLRLSIDQENYELIRKILDCIHSDNRGNNDSLIVDQIEELLKKENKVVYV